MKSIACLLLFLAIVSCTDSKDNSIVKRKNNSEISKTEINTNDSVLKSTDEIFQTFKRNKFQSEIAMDEFCLFYAHSLKKINENENSIYREKMIVSFRAVNELYSQLKYGGTFYGHQYKRVLAEVEYSIYKSKKDTTSKNTFLLNKRNYLRNLIERIEKMEVSNIYNQMDSLYAKRRAKELENILDKIQISVSNQFILNQVEIFENKFYK